MFLIPLAPRVQFLNIMAEAGEPGQGEGVWSPVEEAGGAQISRNGSKGDGAQLGASLHGQR